MAKNQANIKLGLDTKGAKKSLRDLNKTAAGTAKQVGGKIRGGLGGAAGALGLGAIGGMAVGQFKGSMFGGAGDIVGGALGGLISQVESFVFQGKDLEARAAAKAREGLPTWLEGRQKTPAQKKAVRDAALPAFLFRKQHDVERMSGIRDFGMDPRFGGPGASAVHGFVDRRKKAAASLARSVDNQGFAKTVGQVAEGSVLRFVEWLRRSGSGAQKR